MSDILQSHKID